MATETLLILPAVWDAASARAAETAGARALFLSGSSLAASFGLPDLGLVGADDLVAATARIADASTLPLLVDAECGFGSTDALGREARRLQAAGATGILLEDQEFTGQSVDAAAPGLCTPETMVARIAAAKEATGGALEVLARTDVLGAEWPFDETVARLARYRDAGADRLTAVFLRSAEELAGANDVAPDRFVAVAVPGPGGFVPEPEDASAAGCAGVIVTGFLQAMFDELRVLYEAVLGGDTPRLRGRQPSRAEFARAMGIDVWPRAERSSSRT